jgi:hypothetical protein
VHGNGAGKKKWLLQCHDHEDGHANHLEGSVLPVPGTERGVEFDDQVRREFQDGSAMMRDISIRLLTVAIAPLSRDKPMWKTAKCTASRSRCVIPCKVTRCEALMRERSEFRPLQMGDSQ